MENNQIIKPKGVMDYIKEDPFLGRKMTLEEFNNSTVTGFDDSGIGEAYNAYREMLEKTGVKPKGVMDYIKEDPFLGRKMTLGEFNNSIVTGIDDSGVEEAYNDYRRVIAEAEANSTEITDHIEENHSLTRKKDF